MKSGFVSIVGRPNVGKSSILNKILKQKVAIISDVPGTTRNNIQGIYNTKDTQIVFIDTPGIHKPKDRLGRRLNRESYNSYKEADIILFTIDSSSELGRGDEFIIDTLKNVNIPVILVLNKIDKIKEDDLILKILEYRDLYPFSEIVPVSALKDDNVERLISVIKTYLPDNIKYYEDDLITTQSTEFLVSEIVREKVFLNAFEEVPHSLTCKTIILEKDKNITNIKVDIVVDRESIKGIIIGKNGSMVKNIGILARKDIEELLNSKVYLELNVRVVKKWRDQEKYLKELIEG